MDLEKMEILDRISRHCPDAMSAYLHCMNRADFEGNIFFSLDTVRIDMSESFAKFRNKIKKLALENILEWHEDKEGIYVTMADIYE